LIALLTKQTFLFYQLISVATPLCLHSLIKNDGKPKIHYLGKVLVNILVIICIKCVIEKDVQWTFEHFLVKQCLCLILELHTIFNVFRKYLECERKWKSPFSSSLFLSVSFGSTYRDIHLLAKSLSGSKLKNIEAAQEHSSKQFTVSFQGSNLHFLLVAISLSIFNI
jgi:hypothetical protein